MLSKSKITYIRSLEQKKHRQAEQIFICEGAKILAEVLETCPHLLLEAFCTETWANQYLDLFRGCEDKIRVVSDKDIERISLLTTPNGLVFLMRIPPPPPLAECLTGGLVLDNIQDPGNMGTILRIADWFGIPTVLCSPECVDIYNPKVVQATMGSVFRTQIVYTELLPALSSQFLDTYAAVLGGESVWELAENLPEEGFWLMIGNESAGLSQNLIEIATRKVSIPRKGRAESLNAGVATGILSAIFSK